MDVRQVKKRFVDSFHQQPRANSILLRAPIIMLVVAATAVPIELRPLGHNELDFDVIALDVAANVAGYLPIGLALGEFGLLRATIMGALLSILAESCQFMMMYRHPSAIDVFSNALGVVAGASVVVHWNMRKPRLTINRRTAWISAMLALMLIAGAWARTGPPNIRGAVSVGRLEAHWKLDEKSGQVALDSSMQGLDGKFSDEPKRVVGVIGGAVNFDGATEHIDFHHSAKLQLSGSMTISAWINASSFPADDAPIVSNLKDDIGYQLDTTVDNGPRTIGFKLTNECGAPIARYGRTPLLPDRWYHVAGIYDAQARTLDVYLNGQPDNGILIQPVTGTQRSSRGLVTVGRRTDLDGHYFAGSIDDVSIYSVALSSAEIEAIMKGQSVNQPANRAARELEINGAIDPRSQNAAPLSCAVRSDPEDTHIPAVAAAFGIFAAIAGAGFRPSARLLASLIVTFVAGTLFVLVTSLTLPISSLGIIALTTLGGGASVAFSVSR
jgi:hypothetical protein